MVQHLVKLRSFQESKREKPLAALNCKCNTKRVHPVSYGNVKPKMPVKGITFEQDIKTSWGCVLLQGSRIKTMKYEIDKQEKFAIMRLEEENLNSLVAPILKSELVILSNEGVRNLILDLKDVKFVDSSGLSAILTGNRLWSEDKSFIITGVDHPSVKKLLEISRLDSILTLIPSIEESIDYIYMEEIERELNQGPDQDLEAM